jgi:DNA-binding response OmpR family regulator
MPPTLLVADPNVTTQRIVELAFAQQAINIVSASNGQHAIERLASLRPDVALVDLHLHTLNGYEVAGFARRHPELRSIPVLLLAGAFDNVDDVRVRDSGAAGVIVKPFEPANVVAKVNELLESRRATNDTDAPLAPGFTAADAFALLFAEEQGEAAPPVVPQRIVEISDTMIERIADRVADRLTHGVLGESLRRTVHDVSERLVREEIDRIRSAAKSSGTA